MIVNGRICKCQDYVFRLDEVVAIGPQKWDDAFPVRMRGQPPVEPAGPYFAVILKSGTTFSFKDDGERDKLINAIGDYWKNHD